jgi:hypothetical protein
LRAIQENFEEGYVKKKKSGNEGECLSILRGAKKGFNGRKTQQMPKVNTKKKKSSFMSFGMSRIKLLVSSKFFRFIIHQRKLDLHYDLC